MMSIYAVSQRYGAKPSSFRGAGYYIMTIRWLLLATVATGVSSAVSAASPGDTGFANPDLIGFERMEYVPPVLSDFAPAMGAATPLLAASIGAQRQSPAFVPTAKVKMSFEGISQYDVASYARNFIPPDTMGAVGTTQFTEFANGGFAVFGKDGVVQKATSDIDFWAAAGQVGANGDSRVLFNKAANRWVALSFGQSVSDIQIAVSDTADAAGTWRSTKFTGYAGVAPGDGVADYPTLAFDTKAVYIGTNNFSDANGFAGTTLNVIPLKSLFNAAAPTTAGLVQINTPYDSMTGGRDGGYAIQGVMSQTPSATGKVEALSLFYNTNLTYDIANTGTPAATEVNGRYIGGGDFNFADYARQPNTVPDANPNADFANNNRTIDPLDPRISSNVYEMNGLIYSVQTIAPLHDDHAAIRWQIVSAATGELVSQGAIKDGVHDYYQASLSVNALGQVVIAYNRSGSDPADGKVSFFARTFTTSASGGLVQRGGEELLKVSLVDDYHNGSVDGMVAKGRQRWGDYSQVTLDPTDSSKFWVIGEFAREYNDGPDHPLGTGGSRWGTWISEIDATTDTNVPEPATWAMMIAGFGLVGTATRRRRVVA